MEKLTDMSDPKLMLQVTREIKERTSELGEQVDKWIVKELLKLNIDKDILLNQSQEILRLNRILKRYQDLEEQGLLLRLPCKVGDTVYQITRNFISEFRIKSFIQYSNGNIFFDWECTKGMYKRVDGFHIDDIGKNVFLTKEEAEAKLKEMEYE